MEIHIEWVQAKRCFWVDSPDYTTASSKQSHRSQNVNLFVSKANIFTLCCIKQQIFNHIRSEYKDELEREKIT